MTDKLPTWVDATNRVELHIYLHLKVMYGTPPTKREFDRELARVGKELAGDC